MPLKLLALDCGGSRVVHDGCRLNRRKRSSKGCSCGFCRGHFHACPSIRDCQPGNLRKADQLRDRLLEPVSGKKRKTPAV